MNRLTAVSPASALARRLAFAIVAAATTACGGDNTQSNGEEQATVGCHDGTLDATGALYRVCYPASWNGDLVVYAHGYVVADQPLAIPDDHIEGQSIAQVVNGLGYGYATTSYRANGLVADEGVEDVAQLVGEVQRRFTPDPSRTFIVGVSEGGLVAALSAERHPELFDGALAACGPVGDFTGQIDYLGDFRVLFDYFFPRVLGPAWADDKDYGAADRAYVAAHWDQYQAAVLAALRANPLAAAQLIATSRAPIDPLDPTSVGETVVGVLWYNVFATDDARQRLGGRPFDNHDRVYRGSFNDTRLNSKVKRFTAEPTALATIASDFQTTGALELPVVTDHTLLDPIVKASQELLYAGKVALAGQSANLTQLTVPRYGHCAFTAPELQFALATLVAKTASPVVAAKMPAVTALPAMTGTPRFGAFARLGSPMTR